MLSGSEKMKRLCGSGWVVIAILTGILIVLSGCGKGGETRTDGGVPGLPDGGTPLTGDPTQVIDLPVKVVLPEGCPVKADQLKVVDTLGEFPIKSGGSSLKVFAGGPQYTAVYTQAGELVLLGFVDAAHVALDGRSTAEVLVYHNLGAFMLTPDARLDVIKQLHTWNLDALEKAINDALKTDPAALEHLNSTIGSSLKAACDGIRNGAGVKLRGMTVDPGEQQSGIDIDISEGINSIKIRNSSRRRNYIYIDRMSYISAAGDEVTSKTQTIEFDGPCPSGVANINTTLATLAQGNYAYSAKTSDLYNLDVYPADAKSTKYKVTAVGPGHLRPDDYDTLTDERKQKADDLYYWTIFVDYCMPLAFNVLVPAFSSDIDAWVGDKGTTSFLTGFVGICLNNIPDIKSKFEAGDDGGMVMAFINMLTTNTTVRETILNLMLEGLEAKYGKDAVKGAGDIAKSLATVLKMVNGALTSFDFMVQTFHLADARRVDSWDITVLPPNVTLTPKESKLQPFEHITLKAKALEATDDIKSKLMYHWQHGGSAGSVMDASGNSSNDFTSVNDSLEYFADGKGAGTDTISVEVIYYKTSDSGTKKITLGKASATVTTSPGITLSPQDKRIIPGDTLTYTVVADPAFSGDAVYLFNWTNTATAGNLVGGDIQTTSAPAITYKASDNGNGGDTVSVEVIQKKDDKTVTLGKVTATVNVSVDIQLKPTGRKIKLEDSLALTVTTDPALPDDGTIDYIWTNTAAAGNLVGGDSQITKVPTCTYLASDSTAGTDTVTVEITRTKDAKTISFGKASANVTVGNKYALRDIGPAGGLIFYVKDDDSDGWQYLEAAPVDFGLYPDDLYEYGGYHSSTGTFDTVGAFDTAIGTGRANTAKLVAAFGDGIGFTLNGKTYAAKLCDDYSITKDGTTYDDWFLPSKDELNQIGVNLYAFGVGNLQQSYYWSSSESNTDTKRAWMHSFYREQVLHTLDAIGAFAKYSPEVIRAVRAFK
jgi:hypothetical protein